MKNPLVSIIVTTKNEEQNIASCLKSIEKQTYANIETIVVDNASTDTTLEICKQFSVNIFRRGPERSAQRNFGAIKAKGNWLLFLDADMVVSPKVLQECVNFILNNKDILALIVPEQSKGYGFWAECKALERSFYEGVDWIEAARFYRKDIFLKLGGYDENLTGPEDFDLPQRLKHELGIKAIGRIHSYIFHNEGNLSLQKTLQKKFYYGNKVYPYFKKKENNKYCYKQGNILYRYLLFLSHPLYLFRKPIVGFGMLFMKTLEITAIAAGVLNNKIKNIRL